MIRVSKNLKTTKLLLSESTLPVKDVALYGTKRQWLRHGTRRTVFFNCAPCARILAAIEA